MSFKYDKNADQFLMGDEIYRFKFVFGDCYQVFQY